MRLMTVFKLKLKAIELKVQRNILLNLFPLGGKSFSFLVQRLTCIFELICFIFCVPEWEADGAGGCFNSFSISC